MALTPCDCSYAYTYLVEHLLSCRGVPLGARTPPVDDWVVQALTSPAFIDVVIGAGGGAGLMRQLFSLSGDASLGPRLREMTRLLGCCREFWASDALRTAQLACAGRFGAPLAAAFAAWSRRAAPRLWRGTVTTVPLLAFASADDALNVVLRGHAKARGTPAYTHTMLLP